MSDELVRGAFYSVLIVTVVLTATAMALWFERKFAARLLSGKKDDGGCVEEAYLLAMGRPPTDEEQRTATDYLTRVREKLAAAGVPEEQRPAKAWESFARVLFLSNEFVYVN